jgi:hypothetical protein
VAVGEPESAEADDSRSLKWPRSREVSRLVAVWPHYAPVGRLQSVGRGSVALLNHDPLLGCVPRQQPGELPRVLIAARVRESDISDQAAFVRPISGKIPGSKPDSPLTRWSESMQFQWTY